MTLKVMILNLSPINKQFNNFNVLECNGAINLNVVNLRGIQ